MVSLKQKGKKKEESKLSWILYGLLAVTIVLYAMTSSALIGGIALLTILIILVFEVKTSLKSEGVKRSLIDIASAVAAAVVVWLLLIFLLHTSAPVDAVSSCSMLPALHRGDLVVLRGITSMQSFISSTHIPVINVSSGAFSSMESGINSEFIAFFAYVNGNKTRISYLTLTNNSNFTIGLYNTACLSQKGYLGLQSQDYLCYVPPQQQVQNLIRYNYSIGKLYMNGSTFNAIYTSSISVMNASVADNYSNPIIVYQTTGKDSFSGSIIHRLYAVLNVSGSYYFLTRGDNNQALDMEFANYPANQSDVVGYVIADIPLVGYVKLLLSGQLATPAGCNQVLSP